MVDYIVCELTKEDALIGTYSGKHLAAFDQFADAERYVEVQLFNHPDMIYNICKQIWYEDELPHIHDFDVLYTYSS